MTIHQFPNLKDDKRKRLDKLMELLDSEYIELEHLLSRVGEIESRIENLEEEYDSIIEKMDDSLPRHYYDYSRFGVEDHEL